MSRFAYSNSYVEDFIDCEPKQKWPRVIIGFEKTDLDTNNTEWISVESQIFLERALINRINKIDGWFEYHKDWCSDIDELLIAGHDDCSSIKIIENYLQSY